MAHSALSSLSLQLSAVPPPPVVSPPLSLYVSTSQTLFLHLSVSVSPPLSLYVSTSHILFLHLSESVSPPFSLFLHLSDSDAVLSEMLVPSLSLLLVLTRGLSSAAELTDVFGFSES